MLRVNSAHGVRRLLTENYCIEHIITTWQRAAFSESAQFREILLVARKLTSSEGVGIVNEELSKCTITILKRLPGNIEEAKDFANKIGGVAISENETYEDEDACMKKSKFEPPENYQSMKEAS